MILVPSITDWPLHPHARRGAVSPTFLPRPSVLETGVQIAGVEVFCAAQYGAHADFEPDTVVCVDPV